MRKVDYIVVGDGYAAMFFAHQLIKNNKTFVLFSEGVKSASHISAGIINPLVLKRFTRFWLAQEQIDALHLTLKEIETYTGKNYWINEPIHRILHDETEREIWEKKSKREDLKDFLSPNFKHFDDILNPHGTGEVLQSGRLNVTDFFKDFFDLLQKSNAIIYENFNYQSLRFDDGVYKSLKFKQIVFAEGTGVKHNPFFQKLPIIPNKGHQINFRPSCKSQPYTFKKKYFLFPNPDDTFYYGGTHDREDDSQKIDAESVADLEKSLSDFYSNVREITEINFAFRPTVEDRRPILGRHPLYYNYYIFNGLGARGILNGNYFAKDLYHFIENNLPLREEVDYKRFF